MKLRTGKSSFIVGIFVFAWMLFMAPACGLVYAASDGQAMQIGTYEDLQTFIAGINDGSIKADQDAVLTADIKVPASIGNNWVPLARDRDHSYQGTFDGKGYVISGINIERTYPDPWDGKTAVSNYTAFMSFLGESGTVKNLNVNAAITDVNDAAGIVSQNSGLISGCTFEGTLNSNIYPNTGDVSPIHPTGEFTDSDSESGAIAAVNLGVIKDCSTIRGTSMKRGGISCGGIAGAQYNNGRITGCTNNAAIVITDTIYEVDSVHVGGAGGIAGAQMDDFTLSSYDMKPAIENCINNGTITCEQLCGGICGQSMCGDIIDCTNNGSVEGVTANWAGGIVGYLTTGMTLEGDKVSDVRGCINHGDINWNETGTGKYIGGIVGSSDDALGEEGYVAPMRIHDCINYGGVNGKYGVGGVIGMLSNTLYEEEGVEVTNVYALLNFGQVRGGNDVGGIIGACPGVAAAMINYGSVLGIPIEDDTDPSCCVGGIAGEGGLTGNVSCSYNLGGITAPDVAEDNLYLGGVMGAGTGDLPGCYFCMETSGSAVSADGLRPSSQEGVLSLNEMGGTEAKETMQELFDGKTGFRPQVEWTTVENQKDGDIIYAMPPQIKTLPVTLEQIRAAGVDTRVQQESIRNAIVTVEGSCVYTGGPVIPETGVTVTLEDKVLTQGTDYEIFNCYNYEEAGQGIILVKGIGQYTGAARGKFTIVPAKAGIKSLKPGKKKLTVKMKGKPAKCGADFYNIRYRVKGSSTWKTVKCVSAKKIIKKLKKGKKYQVQVQAYTEIDEVVYAGEWSKITTSRKVK